MCPLSFLSGVGDYEQKNGYLCNMKLSFNIEYRAPFGQSLHVNIAYMGSDGHTRLQNLPMHTDDGVNWLLETTSVSFPHVEIVYMAYSYQVEDDNGKVMRREWNGVPRLYASDCTKDFIFLDKWRDISVQHYIYRWLKRPAAVLRNIPYFDKSVIFRVSAPQVESGFSVALLGGEPTLGRWNVQRYLTMYYVGDGDWMLSINAYAVALPLEYKYVVVDDSTHHVVEWERGMNRSIGPLKLESGQQIVAYGGNIRTQCRLICHDDFFNKDYVINHEIRELYI